MKYKSLIIYWLLSISLSFNLCVLARYIAPLHPHTYDTFLWKAIPTVYGIDIRTLPADHPYIKEFEERSVGVMGRRVAATWLASKAVTLVKPITMEGVQFGVGLWVGGWFFIYAVLVYFFPNRIFALLCGALSVFWAYMPAVVGGAITRIGVHDMPAMVFMTLGVLVWLKKPSFLPLVILAGIPFKDTITTLTILPAIAWLTDIRSRCKFDTLVFSVCAIATGNYIIQLCNPVHAPATELVGWCSPESPHELRLWWNIKWILKMQAHSALFICAGTLLASVIVGLMNIKDNLQWLILLGLLCGGLMLCANMQEYRVWLETVPVSILILTIDKASGKRTETIADQANLSDTHLSSETESG